MNQTIRSRIEQIKRGAIPDGYKKTKVGIVPKEWTEHTLSEIFDFKNGLNKEKEAFGKGTPIVNYTDVWGKRGLLKENIKGKVLLPKNEIDLYKVEEGDVFFTRTSETIEEIGLSSVLLEPINDCVFSGFVLRARPKKAGIVKEYNIYCYSSAIMRHEITRKSSMTTRALTNGTLLGEVNINLPNQKEQEKIAEILQEQDRLIELKEKLTEEKKKQKQYLMEVLLTGKVRLPGFTDEWESTTLGDIAKMYQPQTLTQEEINLHAGYPVYGANGVIGFYEKFNHFEPQIIITCRGSTCGTVLLTVPKSWINGNAMVINVDSNKSVNKLFMYYLFSSIDFSPIISGSGQPQIVRSPLSKWGIKIPKIEEQEKISKILKEADEEIKLLETELEEQKRKKQSLMQLLLTGIVRVKA